MATRCPAAGSSGCLWALCVQIVWYLSSPVAFDYLQDALKQSFGGNSQVEEFASNKRGETETEDRLVPTKWVLVGLVLSISIGTLLVWIVFGDEGIKPWATFLGFVLGGMLSIIG